MHSYVDHNIMNITRDPRSEQTLHSAHWLNHLCHLYKEQK